MNHHEIIHSPQVTAKASLLVFMLQCFLLQEHQRCRRPINRLIPRDQTHKLHSRKMGGRVLLKTLLKIGTPLSNSWFSNPGSTLIAWCLHLKQTSWDRLTSMSGTWLPFHHPSPPFTAHCRPLARSRMSRGRDGSSWLSQEATLPKGKLAMQMLGENAWERPRPVLTNRYKVVPHG